MPTGYTTGIYRGERKITFKDYALGCARAFGALAAMRDEPDDAKIPDEFKPSGHYAEAVEKDKKELAIVEKWDDVEAKKQAELAYNAACKAWNDANDKLTALRQRYEAMLAQVEAWTPPTLNHEELRLFMADQLKQSIKYDCTMYDPPKNPGWWIYRAEKLHSLDQSIKYNQERHEKEIVLCKNRTDWVKALKASL